METLPTVGIFSMLAHATLTVKLVLILLVCMSLASWSLIIGKYLRLSEAKKRAVQDYRQFLSAASLAEGMKSLAGKKDSPLYTTGLQAMDELRKLEKEGLLSRQHLPLVMDNLRRTLRQGVSTQTGALSRTLAFLATCANSAPFIGLFGTVWGILHSFQTIGQLKTAALAAVAPGIAEALVATAVGLAVAIPATMAYNLFLSMLSAIEADMVNFAGAFLNTVQRDISGATATTREKQAPPSQEGLR